MSERRITLEGPVNWRDLGGYPAAGGATTAWGRLYRSDSTHRLTADDVPVLRELGIRTAIDFRSAQELDELGIGPLGEAEITHVHTPTFQLVPGQGSSMNLSSGVDFYTSMIEAGAHAYVAAANAIAREDALPAVFSCMAGKDRTGVFAAIVLGLLGVPDEVIVEDYVLTHEVMPQIAAKRSAEQTTKAEQAAAGERPRTTSAPTAGPASPRSCSAPTPS